MKQPAVIASALACVAAFAAAPGDDQLLPLAAQARAHGCAGHGGAREPLRWSEALARAAARMQRGEAALDAVEQEGYRATHVFHARLAGYRTAAQVADALARHYCSALTDARYSDFGFRHEGTQWLVVLATPLEV